MGEKIPLEKSTCCNSPVHVEGDVTQHYVCTKCQQPCDMIPTDNSIPLDKALELYRNLRWRRWPEEKPIEGEQCLVFTHEVSDSVFIFAPSNKRAAQHRGSFIKEEILEGDDGKEEVVSFELMLDACARYWLPLSALPKPEEK